MRVTVIHWNRTEGQRRAAELSRAGFTAESFTPERGDLKALRDNPPDVIVIDLTRLPSNGSAVAAALRQWKATRGIPLVFAGGAADKVQRVRAALPDAEYSDWTGVAECCRHPRTPDPAAVRTPIPGTMESYAGTPLTRKLRLHNCTSICLINAPDEFPEQLEVNRERI